MTTQVLIIHGQLPFAIKLKQALERSAAFEVHPFTSVEAAVDYLGEHVQDVALIDFAIPDFPGDEIVQQVREAQPEIPIIATPKIDSSRVEALGLLACLDAGFNARDLVNLINNFFAHRERPSFSPPATTALLSRLGKAQQRSPGATPKTPENLPEYTSLDNVLSSAGGTNIFEKPPAIEDTPPSAPSELTWAEETPAKPNQAFDDMISSLPPDTPEQAAPRNPFTDLVNSMRTEETHRPLPSRQQQFVEYILTGGMDSLIEELESSQPSAEDTPQQPSPAFDKLAQDEPPPPTFEESGTISDLVTGVHDRSFRNVLSILHSGEELGEEPEPEIAPPSADDFQIDPRPPVERPSGDDSFDFDDSDSKPTPAKVILQRTLEQSMSGGTFSLDELLTNIDAQLPLHRPKVQPLPSWLKEQQRPQDDSFLIHEPDFLPEELPDEPTPSEDLYRAEITQPARGQMVEANPEALETDWLESPGRSGDDTLAFPETLPEEVDDDATPTHEQTVLHEPVSLEDTGVGPGTVVLGALGALLAHEAMTEPEEEAKPVILPDDDIWAAPGDSIPEDFWGEPAVSPEDAMWAEPVAPEDAAVVPEEDVWADAAFEEAVVPFEEESVSQESTGVWYDLPEQDFNTQFEMMAAFEVVRESGVTSGALYAETSIEPAAPAPAPIPQPVGDAATMQDPYLAQLALSLTEVSLELTAEATLLARNQQIVAYAGQMPAEEIDELRDAIADDWDAAPGEVRIRFLTAQGSGKDYMLYSRRTEDDFTLSLIFAGTTPLRDIRRQGQRLVDALLAVPEAPVQKIEVSNGKAAAESADGVSTSPYAYVWLLRDPRAHLDVAASKAIIAGLNIQMREKQWQIQTLQVHEDYVYLLADVPGEEPAFQIVRDLKRRSADIAHAQNPSYVADGLWADSYLVVTPGRELDTEEIQQFINFDRME